jgi:hypothetical protein
MKTWFISLNVAMILSVIAFVTNLQMLVLVATYDPAFEDFLGHPDQTGRVGLGTLWLLVFYGGWIWALIASARGSRGGKIGVIFFNLLIILIWTLQIILFWCPTPCPMFWPVADIIVWTNLLSGLAAGVVFGLQLWSKPQPEGI